MSEQLKYNAAFTVEIRNVIEEVCSDLNIQLDSNYRADLIKEFVVQKAHCDARQKKFRWSWGSKVKEAFKKQQQGSSDLRARRVSIEISRLDDGKNK